MTHAWNIISLGFIICLFRCSTAGVKFHLLHARRRQAARGTCEGREAVGLDPYHVQRATATGFILQPRRTRAASAFLSSSRLVCSRLQFNDGDCVVNRVVSPSRAGVLGGQSSLRHHVSEIWRGGCHSQTSRMYAFSVMVSVDRLLNFDTLLSW